MPKKAPKQFAHRRAYTPTTASQAETVLDDLKRRLEALTPDERALVAEFIIYGFALGAAAATVWVEGALAGGEGSEKENTGEFYYYWLQEEVRRLCWSASSCPSDPRPKLLS